MDKDSIYTIHKMQEQLHELSWQLRHDLNYAEQRIPELSKLDDKIVNAFYDATFALSRNVNELIESLPDYPTFLEDLEK